MGRATYCPYCGEAIAGDGAAFCASCGRRLDGDVADSDRGQAGEGFVRSAIVYGFLAVSVVAVLTAGAYALGWFEDDERDAATIAATPTSARQRSSPTPSTPATFSAEVLTSMLDARDELVYGDFDIAMVGSRVEPSPLSFDDPNAPYLCLAFAVTNRGATRASIDTTDFEAVLPSGRVTRDMLFPHDSRLGVQLEPGGSATGDVCFPLFGESGAVVARHARGASWSVNV